MSQCFLFPDRLATPRIPYNGDNERHLSLVDGRKLSRTARLLELMVRVQTKPRFTAAELAEEFGVSRRTILRDLQALSGMGVPLRSTPGPGGGYSLPRGGRRLAPSLTVDEALGLIVSYEALLRYPVHPFSSEGVSAVTKLRAALPKDALVELDRLRRHVGVVEPVREYEVPLLGELLHAALHGAHLKVVYDSIRSGSSERVIFPFGLYASAGYWYCACFDHKRDANVSMRADRFLAAERVGAEGFERPTHVPLERWPHDVGDVDEERVRVRARVTARGAKSFDLASLFDRIPSGGGAIEASIPEQELDYYASRLLSVGVDVIVLSPPGLVEAIQNKVQEIAKMYD